MKDKTSSMDEIDMHSLSRYENTSDGNTTTKKLSSSKDIDSFSTKKYQERVEEDPNDSNAVEWLNFYKNFREERIKLESSEEWAKDNLEYDLRTTEWILEKVRTSNTYAQNLYAALCNNDFQKLDVLPILKNEKFSCSWRSAGAIIAHMRQSGSYIDWYCSGSLSYDGPLKESYVGEGEVTEEIKYDLKKLGWVVIDTDDD